MSCSFCKKDVRTVEHVYVRYGTQFQGRFCADCAALYIDGMLFDNSVPLPEDYVEPPDEM